MLFNSCFPHIVNFACKAALAAITNLTYVDEAVEGYSDYDPSSSYTNNCIATARSLVNAANYILIDKTNRLSRTDLLAARTRGFPAGTRYANQEVTQRRRLLQTVQAVNGNSGESWRMCYTLRESARPRA